MVTRKQFARSLRNVADLMESDYLKRTHERKDFGKQMYQLKKLGQDIKIVQDGLEQLCPTRLKWAEVFKME
jgi:hypothetical protein